MNTVRRLGATWDGTGTEFRVRSSGADAVELCLYDDGERRFEMSRIDRHHHGIRIEGIGPGTEYGLRVHGPWAPRSGDRFNPAKLLLDPYARSMTGHLASHPASYGHSLADPDEPSELDNQDVTMRSVVVDPSFDWQDVARPDTPMSDSVIYETHVRGLTMRHPGVPAELRGTYAGLGHEVMLEHLASLGVTAVELMPIHQFVQDQHLIDSGRRNYWGYNSIGFLAPHHEYAATDDPVREFKTMVRELHRVGIEVILDVVYNHTAEGNHLGPTLCFRGLDNHEWYRLEPEDPSRYLNWAGTGNVLHFGNASPLILVMDSLRYWVRDMGVDGFRFDLATVLGRTHGAFDPLGGFFGAVASDPVLADVKLIAEPWDVGPGGYQVGAFPSMWSEWNDSYRDVVRDFWRSSEGVLASFASRITGSSDIFEWGGRPPQGSVNYVTSHDGFTLKDAVSYEHRHNHANGEHNRDGHKDNRTWNTGVEGETTDRAVLDLRRRRARSMIATALLSQGVPMILGGDEIGRTQMGNNNAYNQDNGTSWYDWASADQDMNQFVARVIRLRRDHATFRRTEWLYEDPEPGIDHVGWFTPAGEVMTPTDWQMPFARSVALYLDGKVVHSSAGTESDDDFLLLFNAYREAIAFDIADEVGHGWHVVIDTVNPDAESVSVSGTVDVEAFGLVVLMRSSEGTAG